ncbi:MAG: addiction module protein [Armatimonadota bacterium]
MGFALPLDEMTTEEKLAAMERLWEDLCRNAEAVPSPAWHAPILKEREIAVQQGQEQVLDWEEAKKKLREALT